MDVTGHELSLDLDLLVIGAGQARSWQWTRGSALLVGVGTDAAYLAEHIFKHLAESTVA